jgi:hypothetical protein
MSQLAGKSSMSLLLKEKNRKWVGLKLQAGTALCYISCSKASTAEAADSAQHDQQAA